MKRHPYLIIGNSVAAIAGVEGIRQVDDDTPITILAREPHHTYSRPLISYWLSGQVDDGDMFYRPEDFYEQNRVDVILSQEVISVDPQNQTVQTADGHRIAFDKLLIAAGGQPIVPPDIPGSDADGVFTFTTWDDARNIRDFVTQQGVQQAVVVGGGLIGLKSLEALVELGLQTTVVELADRILSATFDQTAAELAQTMLEEAGVTVLCNNTVAEIATEDRQVKEAILHTGQHISCQLVVFAIGVRPNIQMVADTSIAVDWGILVDDHMQTSVADVYAAGDVAQAPALLSDERRCIPILPNAYRQGCVAGQNMAGADQLYRGGLVMNAVDICGLPTISVGMTTPDNEDCEVLTALDEEAPSYKKIVLCDEKVVGAIFVGDIDRAGIFTGLIKQEIDVASCKELLLTEDFGVISLPTEYRKHLVSGMGIEV